MGRALLEPQPQALPGEAPDLGGQLPQRRLVGPEGQHVVHVAQPGVPAPTHREPIDGIEVDVRPELARQVADGQPPLLPGGHVRYAGRLHQPGAQPQQFLVDRLQVLPQPLAQDPVVDVCEVARHVQPQEVAVPSREATRRPDRRVGSPAPPTGERAGPEARLVGGLQLGDERVVDHPVSEARLGDQAPLRVPDPKVPVRIGPPRAVAQRGRQPQQLALQVGVEGRLPSPAPLGAARLDEGPAERVEAGQPLQAGGPVRQGGSTAGHASPGEGEVLAEPRSRPERRQPPIIFPASSSRRAASS